MKWSTLRAVANSRFATATMLIPLIGYLLLFNGTIIDYLRLAQDFAGIEGGDPNQRSIQTINKLYFTYFGLCGIAVGSLIFRLRCPRPNKLGSTAEEYYDKLEKYPLIPTIRRSLRTIFAAYRKCIPREGNICTSPGEACWRFQNDILGPEQYPVIFEMLEKNDIAGATNLWIGMNVDPSGKDPAKPDQRFPVLSFEFDHFDNSDRIGRYTTALFLYGGILSATYPGINLAARITVRLFNTIFP